MNEVKRAIALVLVASLLLLLAGCATPYGSPAPGYPPSGYPPSGPPAYGDSLQGTVQGIDPGYRRILVDVDDPRMGRTQLAVRYDQNTRLFYQGRELAVEGLERGDVIRFDAVQSGREWWTRRIDVLRDVRQGGGGYGDPYGGSGGAHGNELRGSVAYVDTRARTIRLDGAGYTTVPQVFYDDRTTVYFQGRSYRPENLQRGDLVRIQARSVGRDQWLAERVIVERSVGY